MDADLVMPEEARAVSGVRIGPRTYRGERKAGVLSVAVDIDGVSRELPPRLDLVNHSPSGFEQGYLGSGPSQLALALCADALGDDARAVAVYQRFKCAFVARLGADQTWIITDFQLREVVEAIEHAADAHAGGK